MLKRTIEISSDATHLSMQLGQLTLKRKGCSVGSVPCEDLGTLVVDHAQTTYTHAVLRDIAANGGSVIICGHDHLPVGVMVPLATHNQVVQRISEQIQATLPRKKRIWQQLIQAKILASSRVLEPAPVARQLKALATQVRSGDPANVEARAAKLFWRNWLPESCGFRRDQDGDEFNGLLNYGYAIIRAMLARAIISAGYSTAIGIHHHHRANSFCLADDLIEPLRPLVDGLVRDLQEQGHTEVNRETKEALLGLMTQTVRLGDSVGPLNVVVHRYIGMPPKVGPRL